MEGESLQYWVAFGRTAGVGPTRLRRLLNHCGDIEAAWKASPATLRACGFDQRALESLLRARETMDPRRELERVLRSGYKVECWDSDGYPRRLRDLEDAPPVLYLWGEWKDQDDYAAAIVGTRRASSYGQQVARELSSFLASNGVTIVSGLARGIDGVAHGGALEAGGRTLAVLGSGLDRIYPPEHRGLAEKIAAQGVVLTEYALGTEPEGRNFPPRNRIIAGLSLAVIIVEAGRSSGALITADFAAEQGREVFAVPGSIMRHGSEGPHRLIQNGARLLHSPEEVLEVMNLDLVARRRAVQDIIPENETERVVLSHLEEEPLHIDELRARCALPAAEVASTLALLELKGYARQVGGMHYVRARESAQGYRVE